MALRIVQVYAFANRAFRGNPAAVCVLPAARGEAWMQDVAREMNLAETAFLHPENGDYRLRWFTPAVEVALCGHATLASAHVLWEEGHLPAGRASRFFAPQTGVPEDPVTGSAHCALAPFWSERLHKAELTGYQASARGGVVRVRLAGDRVVLGGQAVTVLQGELVQCDT